MKTRRAITTYILSMTTYFLCQFLFGILIFPLNIIFIVFLVSSYFSMVNNFSEDNFNFPKISKKLGVSNAN